MNNSTDGVTVLGVFFLDVLNIYKEKPEIHSELQKIVANIDLSDPNKMQPMIVYNQMLDWIADNLGKANAKIAGKKISNTIHNSLLDLKMISSESTPAEVMQALATVATKVISDPDNRGWEILKSENESLLMRRTQTFNSSVQFGVLEGLLYKCKNIYSPTVTLVKEVEKGDEYDEYLLTWRR